MMTDSLLHHALCYHSFGANVLPIRPDPTTGQPTKAAKQWGRWQKERQTHEDVYSLFSSPHTGIGLVSGIGGFRCFDIDGINNYDVVERLLYDLGLGDNYLWVAHSGSGSGAHIYVRCYEEIQPGTLTSGTSSVYNGDSSDGSFGHLELRCERCYTLVPPSLHPCGQRYAFPLTSDIPTEPPTEVALSRILYAFKQNTHHTTTYELIPNAAVPNAVTPNAVIQHKVGTATEAQQQAQQQTPSHLFEDSYVTAAVADELCILQDAQEGTRNQTLYRTAFKLATFLPVSNLGRKELEALLIVNARITGLELGEIERTMRSGIEAGILHPRQLSASTVDVNGIIHTDNATTQSAVPAPPCDGLFFGPDEPTTEEQWIERGIYPAEAFARISGQSTRDKRQRIRTGLPIGLPSRFIELNEFLGGGFKEGEITFIGGRTSSGKSAFGLQLAMDFALVQKTHTLYISMEMTRDQLFNRIAALRHGMNLRHWSNGQLLPEEEEHFSQCFDETELALAEAKTLHIADIPSLQADRLLSLLLELQQKLGIKCVVLDYLGCVLSGSYKTQEEEYAQSIQHIRRTARELGLVFIVLGQLSRAADTNTGEPRLSDIRGSGRIEQDCHNVLILDRKKALDHPEGEPEAGMLYVLKARDGLIGSIRMQFTRECARWEAARPAA